MCCPRETLDAIVFAATVRIDGPSERVESVLVHASRYHRLRKSKNDYLIARDFHEEIQVAYRSDKIWMNSVFSMR